MIEIPLWAFGILICISCGTIGAMIGMLIFKTFLKIIDGEKK